MIFFITFQLTNLFTMKNRLLAILGVMLCCYSLNAQNEQWTVKPGEDVDTTLPADVKFHYPKFTLGNVFFRDGSVSGALLDYDMLSGKMQFIAPKGDTLELANEATIKYIVINNDTFFYDKVYMQLVAGNTTAKLSKKEKLRVLDIKKAGGYGGVSSTSAIATVNTMRVNGQATSLTMQQEITFTKETSYYIGDAFNHFLPANKKNIIKLFGKKQNAIEQYLKDNKVEFNKEEDLKALISFLEG